MIRRAASSLLHVRVAVVGFLRGFTGVASSHGARAGHPHDHGAVTPAAVRDALSKQAARRGRCC